MKQTKPVRRPQAERSEQMTEKIITTTLDLMYEQGMAATSTEAIARRAGVSRGAILHHYPQKFDLVTAAVDHLLDSEAQKIRTVSAAFAGGDVTLDTLVDELWRMFSGRLFMITMDYLAVARTNDDLRKHLGPVSLKFNRALDDIWRTFFRLSDKQIGRIDITLNLTLCLMRGMGVQTVLKHREPEYFDELIATWKRVLGDMLEPVPTTRPDAPNAT